MGPGMATVTTVCYGAIPYECLGPLYSSGRDVHISCGQHRYQNDKPKLNSEVAARSPFYRIPQLIQTSKEGHPGCPPFFPDIL
jgi:hypothetical protein